jgi:hypothetical protein
LILWGLEGSFFEAFCHRDDALVYVVDDASLLFEFALQGWGAWFGVPELIAEVVVGLLETLPMTGLIAVSLADHEAEGGQEHHPYR